MDGMIWMASAMRAAQAQLETATHNLANVASDGFRRIRSSLVLTGAGLIERDRTDPAQGGLRETGRTLDLALLGPGAFRTPGGTTRDGSFVLARDGLLTTRQGEPVLGRDGPIHVHGPVSFDDDGTVRAGGRAVAHLVLPAGTRIRSGALESSGVDAIAETLAILTSQRAFETAQKTLVAIDQTRDKAVNDVARLK